MKLPSRLQGQPKGQPAFDVLALWILFSAWCSLSGWLLSIVGALNPWGYGLGFLAFIAALAIFGRQLLLSEEKSPFRRGRMLHSRWLLPKIWLSLTVLVFIGGLLYQPVNYDHLTYRFPRILFWSWEHRWYWIPSFNHRLNLSGTGFEWLMVPQFIFLHTDRFFFLINFISFLFLPGLVFSVFRRLGISPRVSWWWMWVLPCGYCYILQAASAGNDSFAAVYLLASLHYALKARTSSSRYLVLSLLAVGLLTGAKASNLPLVLPWLVTVFFNRRPLFAPCKPHLLAVTLIVTAFVSYLPIALLNIHFTGDFTGDPQNYSELKLSNPVSGIAGNFIQIAADNLAPPLWYKPISWDPMIPAPIKKQLKRDYPRLVTKTGEMRIDEDAGVGLGVVAAAVFMIILRLRATLGRFRGAIPRNRPAVWIAVAGFIALLVYMGKMGSESAPRLIAAYYPLFIVGILLMVSLDGEVIRRTLCKIVAGLAMLSAVPLVVLSPSRPLFPVNLVLNYLSHAGVSPGLIQRSHEVYDTYATRYDDFRDLRLDIPETETAIGFVHPGDDPEVSLWLPFGSRKVIDLTPNRTLGELQALHIHYIVVDNTALTNIYHITIDELLKQWSAAIVTQKYLTLKIQRGSELCYLIHSP
ncbi:MAG: hypothetical protein LV481_12790 [Methylacidiphilales bacterium]|nr:hypothetical protein [Candidatus Methylacidiphilales bacterium]